MIFRTIVLALSLFLLSISAAFADDAASTSSSLPKEIQNLDPDRMARPTGSVNTADLAHQLGVTDTMVIWLKFKLNSKGRAAAIRLVYNPGPEEAASLAEAILKELSFAVPTGRNKRKTHYYGLTICPDCSYTNEMSEPVPDPARPEIVSEAAWNEALEALHLKRVVDSWDCFDTANSVYPEMLKQAEADYPREAKRQGVQGEVALQCIIDTSGRVHLARVLKSSGSDLLDQASVDAAYNCRFASARCNGDRVPAIVSFKYEFAVNHR